MARSIDIPTAALDDLERAPADPEARRVVAEVLAGDRDAFRVLVDRETAAVFRVCYRVLGNADEAREASQEAFVNAFRSLPGWREDGPFSAWLARIALHAALRRARRRSAVAWIDPVEPEATMADGTTRRRLAQRLRDDALAGAAGTDPASLAIEAERVERIRAAVLELDEPYRQAVALRYFGELSVPEIARTTGRPEGTIKTHLHRGLARLRDSLERTGGA